MTMYYGLILNSPEVLHTEPIEEVFRERATYHEKHGIFFDAWIIDNPEFLPLVATTEAEKENKFVILSCTKNFIVILNLRLVADVNYFEFEAPSEQIPSPLSSKKS